MSQSAYRFCAGEQDQDTGAVAGPRARRRRMSGWRSSTGKATFRRLFEIPPALVMTIRRVRRFLRQEMNQLVGKTWPYRASDVDLRPVRRIDRMVKSDHALDRSTAPRYSRLAQAPAAASPADEAQGDQHAADLDDTPLVRPHLSLLRGDRHMPTILRRPKCRGPSVTTMTERQAAASQGGPSRVLRSSIVQ